MAVPLRVCYKCVTAIALTEAMDIGVGKILRTLAVGEVVEAVDNTAEDAQTKLLRVKVKTRKDAKTGYATIVSQAGTTYLEKLSDKAVRQLDAE
jgi:hypothetical protein